MSDIPVEGCNYRRVYFGKFWEHNVPYPVAGEVAQEVGAVGTERYLELQCVLFYLPVLCVSGILCGVLTGIVSGIIVKRGREIFGKE